MNECAVSTLLWAWIFDRCDHILDIVGLYANWSAAISAGQRELDLRQASYIPPMDLVDATAYLRHHLAGRSDQLFTDDALARLQRHSNGIPRPQ